MVGIVGWWAQRSCSGLGWSRLNATFTLSKGVSAAYVPTCLRFAFLLCSEDSNRVPHRAGSQNGLPSLEDAVRPFAAVLGGCCRLRAPAGWSCSTSAFGGSCRRVPGALPRACVGSSRARKKLESNGRVFFRLLPCSFA